MAIEHGADEVRDGVIGEAERAVPAFEGSGREETAVEKRHRSEGAGGGCAVAARRVERAEEERAQQALVEVPTAFELGGGVVHEKVEAMVEPALRFEERQEETARGAEQRQFAAFCG